jgi:hypothetical protein
MAGQNQLEPVQDEEAIASAGASAARLNAHLLDMLPSGDGLTHLASPVTGAGVRIDRLQQLCLLALRRGLTRPEAWAELAQRYPPADDSVSQVTDKARSFAENELPLLRALRIA